MKTFEPHEILEGETTKEALGGHCFVSQSSVIIEVVGADQRRSAILVGC